MSTIDHIGFPVTDMAASLAFYDAALGALGLRRVSDFQHEGHQHVGYGVDRPFFWISPGGGKRAATHVAFTSASRAGVNAFHSVALANGGRDNGAPGLRAHYHAHYFAAFVFDPDGNNIEAVCHDPE